jgi:acyl-CoA synthetase (AMP-forming)/AMP-acid ligase II
VDSSLSLKLISAVQAGESFLAENPNWNSETLALMQDFFSSSQKNSPAHVWVASSGTRAAAGDSVKLVGLSHEAMLVSAGAVNQHLRITETDVWGLCLPLFHVGGLAILYRSFLSGAKVQEVSYAKNNLADFVRERHFVELSSDSSF